MKMELCWHHFRAFDKSSEAREIWPYGFIVD